jgi:hypothetical protein
MNIKICTYENKNKQADFELENKEAVRNSFSVQISFLKR